MSHVRMCDKCGNVFSENEDGWSTFSGARRVRDKDTGRVITQDVTQDACASCTNGMFQVAPNVPALTKPPVSE